MAKKMRFCRFSTKPHFSLYAIYIVLNKIDSAQEDQSIFQPLNFEYTLLDSNEQRDYCAPITSQEGTIIVNTQVLEENGLDMPTCLKDLTDPQYKDMISVTDIKSSSTAWLLIQALVSEYGEDGAKEVLTGIYENAGPHIEVFRICTVKESPCRRSGW